LSNKVTMTGADDAGASVRPRSIELDRLGLPAYPAIT
jgi:hypothetical protein